MKRILDKSSVALISYLMSNTDISDRVLNDKLEKDKYKFYTVREDGTIIFGKAFLLSKSFSRFWCQLIGCQDKIPFESFALKVWDALIDLSKGKNAEALLNGLSTEIAEKAQRKGEYNWVVKRLYDCYEHVCNNKGEASPEGDLGKSGPRVAQVVRNKHPENLVININGVQKEIINISDSIGDPMIDLVYEPHFFVRGGV